jgi:uncharacterized repeat protein (TIGR03803 family)
VAGLLRDSQGHLYGTTQYGGSKGSGVIFELARNGTTGAWSEKVLHNFCSKSVPPFPCADGGDSLASLTMDSSGNLYGTTLGGGTGPISPGPGGVVFEVSKSRTGKWSERVLYSFCQKTGCADGEDPQSSLVMDSAGNLYGTTENGGAHGSGTVFKLHKNTTGAWTETVLHNFCSTGTLASPCLDGATPEAGLVLVGTSHLYGTAYQGGLGNPGFGLVFDLSFDTSTGKWVYGVLHRFCNATGKCADGNNPPAGLIVDAKGRLDGITSAGGIGSGAPGGTVFRVTTGGTETPIYLFCGSQCSNGINNGGGPQGGLVLDTAGNLYGTTTSGGANIGGGEVFEFTP